MSIPVTVYVNSFNSIRDQQEAVMQIPAVITDTNGVYIFQPFSFISPSNQASTEKLRIYHDEGHYDDELLRNSELEQLTRLRADITDWLDCQMQIWFQKLELHYNYIETKLASMLTLISQGFSRQTDTGLKVRLNNLKRKLTNLQSLFQPSGVHIKANPSETFNGKKQKVNEWKMAAITWIIASGFFRDQATVAIFSLLQGLAQKAADKYFQQMVKQQKMDLLESL